MSNRLAIVTLLLVFGTAPGIAPAAEWGLKQGDPALTSTGPLAFGPDGILFIADTKAAAVVAIDTADASGDPAKASPNVELNGIANDAALLRRVPWLACSTRLDFWVRSTRIWSSMRLNCTIPTQRMTKQTLLFLRDSKAPSASSAPFISLAFGILSEQWGYQYPF